MLVWLASFPRSGNTFLRMAIHWNTAERPYTYSITKDLLFSRAGIVEGVGHRPMPKMSLKKMAESEELYMVKCHAGVTDLKYKAPSVFIVRDPRDVMVSLSHWQVCQLGGNKRSKKGSKDWREYFNDFYNTGHWHTYCEKSLDYADVVVKYEELIEDSYAVVKRVVGMLNLPLTMLRQDMPTFEEMHEKLPCFFRQGMVGSGRDVFTPKQEAAFYAEAGHMMARLGYERYTEAK